MARPVPSTVFRLYHSARDDAGSLVVTCPGAAVTLHTAELRLPRREENGTTCLKGRLPVAALAGERP